MRIVVTGSKETDRADFITGWRSLVPTSEIESLPGSRDISDHQGPLSILSPEGTPAPIIEEDPATSAPWSPALNQIIELAATGPVTISVGSGLAHDGGAGALQTLDPTTIAALRAHAHRITIAAREPEPLLGLHGRGALLAKTNDAVAAEAAERDREIGAFVHQLSRQWEADPRLARAPGSAMAGGLAFVLAAAGARLAEVARVVSEQHNWAGEIARSQLAVVLTRSQEPMTLLSGVFLVVGELAQESLVPVAAVSRASRIARRHLANAGITDHYDLDRRSFSALGRSLAATWQTRR